MGYLYIVVNCLDNGECEDLGLIKEKDILVNILISSIRNI